MKLLKELSAEHIRRSNGYVPHCSRYVYQCVGTIEQRQCSLMAMQEPLLHIMLSPRKEEFRPTELLVLQQCQSMSLRHLYYRFIEYQLRKNFRHAVECVRDGPIEHFNQKRELLKYAAVDVV